MTVEPRSKFYIVLRIHEQSLFLLLTAYETEILKALVLRVNRPLVSMCDCMAREILGS